MKGHWHIEVQTSTITQIGVSNLEYFLLCRVWHMEATIDRK